MSRSSNKYLSEKFMRNMAMVYIALCVALCFFQERLIYSPLGPKVGDWDFCNEREWATEIEFKSRDGTKLVGYFLENEGATSTILLCHGANENIGTVTEEICVLRQELNANIFVFDYRGFGKSGGWPDEQGAIDDGLAAMQKLNELSGTGPNEVIIIGRSLGGGVAARVAVELGARGLVLHSTYSAMDDLCASKIPFIPVRALLRTKFRTIDWIPHFNGPVMFAHGTDDSLIPIANSERLFAACGSDNKRLCRQHDVGHFDALNHEFISLAKQFVDGVGQSDLKQLH